MESRVSLIGVSVAAMLFAVTVAMHEASRADHASQAVAPAAVKPGDLVELLQPFK